LESADPERCEIGEWHTSITTESNDDQRIAEAFFLWHTSSGIADEVLGYIEPPLTKSSGGWSSRCHNWRGLIRLKNRLD